ncbi:juvenile hormone acid O-methyltransferase-like [Lutzomyia longipalpis]|uniref:juvenile hormone acid O-methyltransferase-like n=1 Tax=Lutzomyia longipalpis TaxID=7200 RepID=UPI002483C397|nr:juvenile hormone acid O-methyltransferase-like [Lutzomyia longipalpis]
MEISDFNTDFLNEFKGIRDYYTELFIGKLSELVKWRPNGSILEVGCGTGDATLKYICPELPEDFSKLVCTDISEEMVEETEKLFAKEPKISSNVLDITRDLQASEKNQFDHIISLECLMWVTNQQKAFQNLYDFLKPGGSCFLIFVRRTTFCEVIFELSARPKWRKFVPKVKEMYPYPYRHDPNPVKTITELMESIGFVNVKVEMRESKFLFRSKEEFLGFVKALPNPLDQMTLEEQDEYLKEAADLAFSYENVIDQSGFGGGVTGTQLMAYGEK